MGYRCGWRIIGRNDYIETAPLPEDQKEAISTLKVTLSPGKKTIFDVFRGDTFIGQVRTLFWGQFYRTDPSSDFLYVTNDWNSEDPYHGHALAALIGYLETEVNYPALKDGACERKFSG